jgi:hypothetical protein
MEEIMSKTGMYEWLGFGYRKTYIEDQYAIEIFIATEIKKNAKELTGLDGIAMGHLRKWPELCEKSIKKMKKYLSKSNQKIEITPAMVRLLSLSLFFTGDSDYDHIKYLIDLSNENGSLLEPDNLEIMQVIHRDRIAIEPVYDE